VQQTALGDAVDIRQAAIGIGLKIEASNEIEQAAIGAVGDIDRQRLLVECLNVAADQTIEKRIQTPLFGFAPAQDVEFLLEVPESSQTVVLLRKPGMKVVHISLFELLKKLSAYTAAPLAAPRLFLHPRPACQEGPETDVNHAQITEINPLLTTHRAKIAG
jgi:hypothetical protein